VTAIDISPEALEIARSNAARHGVEARIEFISGDLLSPVPQETVVDYIVSNPPYVRTSEWDALAPDVRDHEPRAALVSGETGTEMIARLIEQAATRLRPGGWLITEISPMIESNVTALFAGHTAYGPTRFIKDLADQTRVVVAQRVEPVESI
jgi:release factor glutamine methyltransferase